MNIKHKILFFTLGILAICLTFSAGLASESNPPIGDLPAEMNPPNQPAVDNQGIVQGPLISDGTVNAFVLRSRYGCSSTEVIWDSLNSTWSDYGSIPIHITYDYAGLCSGPITYESLAASGADVLILSDPAGGLEEYAPAEISAIQQYASEGHNLIGTYLLFQWSSADNRGLAPLFGLQSVLTYTVASITPTYFFLEPGNPLSKNLTPNYVSDGLHASQIPAVGSWGGAALNGARQVGMSVDQQAAILVYDNSNYHAIYITSMPEFNGGAADKQFFYNAITYNSINAVVLKSWNGCNSTEVIWDSLNATWSDYGTTPIEITYDYPGLCSGTITYAGLVASGADVLILSSSGGKIQFTSEEISAIQQYANEGHNLIATFLLLQYGSVDNRGFAPLFGLNIQVPYTWEPSTPSYSFLEPSNPLFNRLTAPYVSSGSPNTQVPASGTWSGIALDGARFVGINADQKAAITVYDTSRYHAIYITTMPEYLGGTADKQFFYNAITYDEVNAVVLRSWSGCTSDLVIWNSLNATWSDYGITPIHITYDYPGLCNGPITYAGLVASGADVLILSDPAGDFQAYTPAEVSAIQSYANEGHNLIGTSLLLQYGSTDNRGLAPLFGLNSQTPYILMASIPSYSFLEPGNPLFYRLSAPYESSAFPTTQVPAPGMWSEAALDGARFVGINPEQKAVILVYDAPRHHAIYITTMPEYSTAGTADKQFFYNAITFHYTIYLPVTRK